MIKVFLVILNWNGYKDTIECLESVSKVEPENYELHVVVIDNASTDNSVDKIMNFKTDKLEFNILTNKKNLGFAGGNNVGIKYSLEKGADYILLLNNDTTVQPDFLEILVYKFETDNQVGIIAPRINYYDEPEKIWSDGGKIS